MAFQIQVTRLYLCEGWLGLLTNVERECWHNCIPSPGRMSSSFLQTKIKWCIFNNLPWIQSLATAVCAILTRTIEKLVRTLTLRLNLFCLTSNEQTYTYWYEHLKQVLSWGAPFVYHLIVGMWPSGLVLKMDNAGSRIHTFDVLNWRKLEMFLFLSFIRGLWTCDAWLKLVVSLGWRG